MVIFWLIGFPSASVTFSSNVTMPGGGLVRTANTLPLLSGVD